MYHMHARRGDQRRRARAAGWSYSNTSPIATPNTAPRYARSNSAAPP
jgi:hypothetical protein